MVARVRIFAGVTLCVLLAGCITTHRIQVVVSRTGTNDLARTRHVCARVAAQHDLTLVEAQRRAFPNSVEEYAKSSRTIFGGHDYTEPDMIIVGSASTSGSTVITIGHWLDTPERSKIADDTLAALQHEFGKDRVQRHDDRWTEW